MNISESNKKTTPQTSLILMLVISCSVFAGCSSMAEKIPLNDPPSPLETNFGWAVKRMKEIQQRPMVGYGPVAGYELEGSEAEKIITAYDGRE